MLIKCKSCNLETKYYDEEFYWDYKGFGYDTKLCKCRKCGKPIIAGYREYDVDINNDKRLYKYNKNK